MSFLAEQYKECLEEGEGLSLSKDDCHKLRSSRRDLFSSLLGRALTKGPVEMDDPYDAEFLSKAMKEDKKSVKKVMDMIPQEKTIFRDAELQEIVLRGFADVADSEEEDEVRDALREFAHDVAKVFIEEIAKKRSDAFQLLLHEANADAWIQEIDQNESFVNDEGPERDAEKVHEYVKVFLMERHIRER